MSRLGVREGKEAIGHEPAVARPTIVPRRKSPRKSQPNRHLLPHLPHALMQDAHHGWQISGSLFGPQKQMMIFDRQEAAFQAGKVEHDTDIRLVSSYP